MSLIDDGPLAVQWERAAVAQGEPNLWPAARQLEPSQRASGQFAQKATKAATFLR